MYTPSRPKLFPHDKKNEKCCFGSRIRFGCGALSAVVDPLLGKLPLGSASLAACPFRIGLGTFGHRPNRRCWITRGPACRQHLASGRAIQKRACVLKNGRA